MEKIVYSDVLNETELLRSLAKANYKTLGLRVLNAYDLALFISTKICFHKQGRYITNEEEDFIYFNLLNPSCFDDAKNVRMAINTFKDSGKGNTHIELEAYLDSNYQEKRDYILLAFKKYEQYKKENDLYDLYDYLYALKDHANNLNISLTYYEDLPYSPLAIDVFSLFFKLQKEQYSSLFDKKEPNIEIVKCFGKNNEQEYLLNSLYLKSIPLDNCTVVILNNNFLMGLLNRFNELDLPFTTSLGISFSHTNVGKFVNALKEMSDLDYGVDAYKNLFSSSFFKKENYLNDLVNEYDIADFIKYLGYLKQDFNSDIPFIDDALYQSDGRDLERTVNICSSIRKICDDINKDRSIYDFIEKNVVEDEYNFESLNILKKYYDYSIQYQLPFDVIIEPLLKASIGKHISRSGAIHICSLTQAFSIIREHAFILGLDSSFPGSPKENYLIYDEEYLKMDIEKYTSYSLVKEKESLMRLFINANSNVHLSYSFFNNIDNKSVNPSSIIFNLQNKGIKEFSYEDDILANNLYLIKLFNKGIIDTPNKNELTYDYDPNIVLSHIYKASSFGDFFLEDKKLGFILSNIFGLDIDEEEDTHEIISARDRGNIFHEIVRGFDKNKQIEEDKFINYGLSLFDDYLKIKPPVIEESAKKEREFFKRGLKNFYNQDPGNKCLYYEHSIFPSKILNIKFKGTFDRLEVDNAGHYILVDYKTGTTNHHINNDVITCMQGLIYSYLIEQDKKFKGIKIYKCEFRYPFINSSSYILYNEETKKALKEKILEFIKAVEEHKFSFDLSKQRYIDKYAGLISLMKELNKQDE